MERSCAVARGIDINIVHFELTRIKPTVLAFFEGGKAETVGLKEGMNEGRKPSRKEGRKDAKYVTEGRVSRMDGGTLRKDVKEGRKSCQGRNEVDMNEGRHQ